jgi:hypothetical protein
MINSLDKQEVSRLSYSKRSLELRQMTGAELSIRRGDTDRGNAEFMKEHPWSALPGKALLACLFLVACTPAQLPQPDPLKDEVIILQKQLLELQKLQLQTKTKLAEATTTIDALSIKVKALEDRQNRAAAPLKQDPPAVKKKPVNKPAGKKKKKIRRQE